VPPQQAQAQNRWGNSFGDVTVGLAKTFVHESGWIPDLLGRVRAQLDTARRTGIEYEVADTFEIRVVADQTVIETQISVWTECLKDVRR